MEVKKLIKLSFLIILGLVLVVIILIRLPIKKATKTEFNIMPKEQITEKDEVLICMFATFAGPQWLVIGKNNNLFDEPEEVIILKVNGKLKQNFCNWDLLDPISNNKFIFEGKFIGKQKFNTDEIYGKEYRVFELEKWTVSYPVKRGLGVFPKDYLVPYDYLPINR